jgi:hypothetical protein
MGKTSLRLGPTTMLHGKIRAGHPRTVDRTQKRAVVAHRASGLLAHEKAGVQLPPDSGLLRRTIAAALREDLNLTSRGQRHRRYGPVISLMTSRGMRARAGSNKQLQVEEGKAYGDKDHRLPMRGANNAWS